MIRYGSNYQYRMPITLHLIQHKTKYRATSEDKLPFLFIKFSLCLLVIKSFELRMIFCEH